MTEKQFRELVLVCCLILLVALIIAAGLPKWLAALVAWGALGLWLIGFWVGKR